MCKKNKKKSKTDASLFWGLFKTLKFVLVWVWATFIVNSRGLGFFCAHFRTVECITRSYYFFNVGTPRGVHLFGHLELHKPTPQNNPTKIRQLVNTSDVYVFILYLEIRLSS